MYYELVQLLWKLLVWDPEKRPTAEQALQSPFFKFDELKNGSTLQSCQIFDKGNKSKQQAERSCESLSLFLQMRNQPANLHPFTPVMTPLDVIKASNHPQEPFHRTRYSDLSDLSTKRKHKRYQTSPLTLAESAYTHSPHQAFFSPTLSSTSPRNPDIGPPSRLVLSPPIVNARETPVESTLKLPFKQLTAEDYKTPPPSCRPKMVSQSRRSRVESGRNSNQFDFHILHPPSFDDVVSNPSLSFASEAMSPFQIPFHFQYPPGKKESL